MNNHISMVAMLLVGVFMLYADAHAASYNWSHNSTALQETILLNSMYETCRSALGAEETVPSYCTNDCGSCTPTTMQKQAYIFSRGTTAWFQQRRREVRQRRAAEVCTLYRGASDTVRAQVDVLANLPVLATGGAGESYTWAHSSNSNQEATIRASYELTCQELRSASEALPANCNSECFCTPTTGEKQAHIFSLGFSNWFTAERTRLRDQRLSSFCAAYPNLTNANQDEIDALLGLPPY